MEKNEGNMRNIVETEETENASFLMLHAQQSLAVLAAEVRFEEHLNREDPYQTAPLGAV